MSTGAVDESGEGVEVIDEIEDIPVGETQDVTVELEAGELRPPVQHLHR